MLHKIFFLFVFLTTSTVKSEMRGVTEGLNDDDLDLDYETVARIASLPLHCYEVEYPNKLNQVLNDETDLLPPSILHPVFHGCFDWHSSVHGHWLMARALDKFPDTDLSKNITKGDR